MIDHDDVWGCLEYREDMDGQNSILYRPDRRDPSVVVLFDARSARALSARLRKFANIADPPKKRRKRS